MIELGDCKKNTDNVRIFAHLDNFSKVIVVCVYEYLLVLVLVLGVETSRHREVEAGGGKCRHDNK